MIEGAEPRRARSRWRRATEWLTVVAILLALLDAVRQTHWKGIHNPNDFVTLYAGSFCMTHACNPYSVPDLEAVLVEKRGLEVRQDWSDQLPIYPPTTLVLLLPMSMLPYKSAMTVWYLGSLLIYAIGLCWTFLASDLRRYASLPVRLAIVLLGLHFPKMLQCLGFGNPSLIVTGLMLFSVFDSGESRRWLRYIATGVACLLKPPLALPLAAVMLLRQRRIDRRGWMFVAGLGAAGVAMGVLAMLPVGMTHWRADLSGNIARGERGGMNPSLRGNASNAILNVANVVGYFSSDAGTIRATSLVVAAAFGVVFVLLIGRQRRSPEWERGGYLLASAAAAALTLLPVYHRFCDIGVLLAVVPWVLWAFARRPSWQAWTVVPMLGMLYFAWERRIHLETWRHGGLGVVRFLYYRGDALLVLLLSSVLLSAMYLLRRADSAVAAASVREA